MKNILAIFCVILLVLLNSCNRNTRNEEIIVNSSHIIDLFPTEKKFSIDLDNKIINRSSCLFYYDSLNSLYYLNGNNIFIFRLNTLTLHKTIKLDFEGPDGVGNVMGFEVLNKNSIYITSAFQQKLFLVDEEGRVKSKIDYSKYRKNETIHSGLNRSLENMRMEFYNSKIYLPYYTGYDEGNYKSILPERIRMIAELDTLNRKIETLNIGFPKNYWKDQYYPPFFGFFVSKGKFYLNYMYDDLVMTSSDGQEWSAYHIPSKFANVKNGVKEGQGVGARYMRLIFDPYQKVFYRFVFHEQKNIKDRITRDLIQYPQYFSIIILNEKMEIIGETSFPADTYDASGYFITKDGLYLSLSNPFNPNYKIDKIEFQLFKLSSYEK